MFFNGHWFCKIFWNPFAAIRFAHLVLKGVKDYETCAHEWVLQICGHLDATKLDCIKEECA